MTIASYFFNWAFTLKQQLAFFFNYHSKDTGYSIIHWLLFFSILALGLLVINFVFAIATLTEKIGTKLFFKKVKDKGIFKSLKYFIKHCGQLGENNIRAEIEREKFPKLFIGIILLYFPLIEGSPLINNSYGVYKTYEIDDLGRYGEQTKTISFDRILFNSNERSQIQSKINEFEHESTEENYFDVHTKGFIFKYAAYFEGFLPSQMIYFNGHYIECLAISFLEKLIITIIYFLIPFILIAYISDYVTKKYLSKTN